MVAGFDIGRVGTDGGTGAFMVGSRVLGQRVPKSGHCSRRQEIAR